MNALTRAAAATARRPSWLSLARLVAGFAAALATFTAGAAQPVSLDVTLMIFSGRPNPTFTLTDPAEVRQIVAVLDALPAQSAASAGDAFAGRLGYAGFNVVPNGLDGVAWFEVYGSAVQVGTSNRIADATYRYDKDSALEQLLFQFARARGVVGATPPIEPPIGPISANAGARVTGRQVTIELGAPIITIVALPIPAPITVTAGTRVRLVATQADESATVTWVKDSRERATAGRVLEFTATPADSGRYWAVIGLGTSSSTTSPQTELLVTAREGQRLINLSVLGRISAEQRVLTAGFTIEGGGSVRALMLVRVVGPGLAPLGIGGTLRTPQLRVTDAAGAEVPPANIPFSLPTIAAATERVGAFALPAGSADAARLYYLPGGAFTAHASSVDDGSGTVLLEIFEVPLN